MSDLIDNTHEAVLREIQRILCSTTVDIQDKLSAIGLFIDYISSITRAHG